MTSAAGDDSDAGPAGPVAIFAGALLVAAAPIVRASDYFFVLVGLEWLALCVIVALVMRISLAPAGAFARDRLDPFTLALLASPLLIAVVQLAPLPPAWWEQLPGHARYMQALQAAGFDTARWRPVTISPHATSASLLAGLPLVAAFLLGWLGTVLQLRLLLRIVAVVAFGEVLLALLQVSGGQYSPFYFGMMTFGAPIGTLGTRNEYANLLAMGLCGYIWLAYDAVRYSMRFQPGVPRRTGRFDDRHAVAAWAAGGLVLVVGLLASQSRAGITFGIAAGALALVVASLRVFGRTRGWRVAAAATALAMAAALALVGLDPIASRISGEQVQASASFRGELARTSLDAAWAFFPLGSGWGTYDIAYRPFQPPAISGYPNHAHMDYVEMLVEGGALFVGFAACFGVAALRRVASLISQARHERTLDRESMLAALCGIGLAGFLAHAAVDFPMRVPANAIFACLMAGAFLRSQGSQAKADAPVVQ